MWVRLVADPQSLPASRRFARDAVTQWRLPDLVEDVALCVSELAANAALHSGSEYLELALVDGGNWLRGAVDDHGPRPADALIEASVPTGAGYRPR